MKLDTFQAWCTAQKISTSLDIRQSPDGSRYTALVGDIPSTDRIPLLQVPLPACITASSSEALADRLLFERTVGDLSNYKPYLDLLPPDEASFASMPRFWSETRVASVTDGGQLKRALERDQSRLNPAVVDPWAMACVDSRSHFLPDGTYSLTPVLDMINHEPGVDTSLKILKEDDEGSISLSVASESMSAASSSSSWWDASWWGKKPEAPSGYQRQDKEVCISYGDFSNLHTLMNYGFVVPNNPHNTEELYIRMIRATPVRITLQKDGTPTEDGLSQLRQLVASTEEKEILDCMPAAEKNPLLFVSPRNEDEVYGLLAAEIDLAVDQATDGARVAGEAQDALVETYLKERARTLQLALDRIKTNFPQVLM